MTAADIAKALQALDWVAKQDLKNVPGLSYNDILDARINLKVVLNLIKVEVKNA